MSQTEGTKEEKEQVDYTVSPNYWLFEALSDIFGITALEDEMSELINIFNSHESAAVEGALEKNRELRSKLYMFMGMRLQSKEREFTRTSNPLILHEIESEINDLRIEMDELRSEGKQLEKECGGEKKS